MYVCTCGTVSLSHEIPTAFVIRKNICSLFYDSRNHGICRTEKICQKFAEWLSPLNNE